MSKDSDDNSDLDLDDDELRDLDDDDDFKESESLPTSFKNKGKSSSNNSTERFKRHMAAPSPSRNSSGSVAKMWKTRGKEGAVDQSVNLMSPDQHNHSGSAKEATGSERKSFIDIVLERESMKDNSSRSSLHSKDGGNTKWNSNGRDPDKKKGVTRWPFCLFGSILVMALIAALMKKSYDANPNSSASTQQTPPPVQQIVDQVKTEEQEAEAAQRLSTLENLLIQQNISPDLQTEGSPARKALQWIATQDPLKLSLDDASAVLPRYALAVFYYAQHPDAGTEDTTADKSGGRRRKLLRHRSLERMSMDVTNREFFDKTWMTKHTICQWHGVICHKGPHVLELKLARTMLQGPIPPELFAVLPHLIKVDLTNNEVQGTVPTSILKLTSLQQLQLGHNQLTGSLPKELLQKLTAMKELVVTSNQLTGNLPETPNAHDNLQLVSFSSNQFGGTIPASYGQHAPNLYRLDLNDNKHIKGAVPSELGLLTRLEHLQLQGNNLTGTVPQPICALRHATTLDSLMADCTTGNIQCQCCTECH